MERNYCAPYCIDVEQRTYFRAESTWEPPANLVNCKDLIMEYERSLENGEITHVQVRSIFDILLQLYFTS